MEPLPQNGAFAARSNDAVEPANLERAADYLLTPPESLSPAEQAAEMRRRRAADVDDALFERIALDRDEQAFSELYDRFSGRIYALLLHMLRSEEDAQDLLQEIFILIWNKAPEFFRSQGNPAAWVLTLARNRAVDEMRSKRYRKKKSEQSLTLLDDRPDIDRLFQTTRTPEAELASKEAQVEVARALKILNKDQRETIDLAYFGGLTYSEIAERKGVPVSTVKSRVRQSVMKLAGVIKPRM